MWMFLIIFGTSLCFFVAMSIFGGDDHDGGFEHDGEIDSGHDGPSILSVRNLFLFGVAFGGVGTIASLSKIAMWASIIWALSSGVVMVLLVWSLLRVFYRQQCNSTQALKKLIGSRGRVTIRIPKGGQGQIRVQNEFGTDSYLIASSNEGQIAAGDTVVVQEIVGSHAHVARAH